MLCAGGAEPRQPGNLAGAALAPAAVSVDGCPEDKGALETPAVKRRRTEAVEQPGPDKAPSPFRFDIGDAPPRSAKPLVLPPAVFGAGTTLSDSCGACAHGPASQFGGLSP